MGQSPLAAPKVAQEDSAKQSHRQACDIERMVDYSCQRMNELPVKAFEDAMATSLVANFCDLVSVPDSFERLPRLKVGLHVRSFTM